MMREASAGYLRSGLPYHRFGHGPRPLVILQGWVFENKPQSGPVTRMYNFLGVDVIGISTGGSIVQEVAADLPNLARRMKSLARCGCASRLPI